MARTAQLPSLNHFADFAACSSLDACAMTLGCDFQHARFMLCLLFASILTFVYAHDVQVLVTSMALGFREKKSRCVGGNEVSSFMSVL